MKNTPTSLLFCYLDKTDGTNYDNEFQIPFNLHADERNNPPRLHYHKLKFAYAIICINHRRDLSATTKEFVHLKITEFPLLK